MQTPMPKILVVDDDASVVRTLSVLLEGEGFVVVTATDGDEAVAQARRERPDLILLDLHMNRVSGLAACTALREDQTFRLTPILMLTATEDADAIVRCLAAGANDFIVKAAEHKELLARLRRHLSVHDSFREEISIERLIAIGQIARTVHHEVYNPLTSVLGLLELCLRSKDLPDKSRTLIERAHGEATRIGEIIDRLTSAQDRPVDPHGMGEIIDLS